MRAFRLSRKKYAQNLSGLGAAKSGNRWNSKGVEVIYCAESRALAMAEVAVHLTIATLPSDYVMMEIDIPDFIKTFSVNVNDLPDDWNSFPHSVNTQLIGDEFIKSQNFCVLKVPSAVVKGDHNYLINPYHSGFKRIKIAKVYDFPFDRRLFE